MPTLCSNRVEGFGPLSTIYPHVTTSCFNDTILVPLSVWVWVLLVVPFFFLGARRRTADLSSKPTTFHTGPHDPTRLRPKKRIWREVVWGLCIVALIAMESLELARLETAAYGIGLLPFVYVGLLLAVVIRWHGRRSGDIRFKACNMVFWIFITITVAVKLAELALALERDSKVNTSRTQYPDSDRLIDVAVMLGIYSHMIAIEWL